MSIIGGVTYNFHNREAFCRYGTSFYTLRQSMPLFLRIELEFEQPIELTGASFHFDRPLCGSNLLADTPLQLSSDGKMLLDWRSWHNNQSPITFAPVAEHANTVRITPTDGAMNCTLYAQDMRIPAAAMVKASVVARGSGDLQMLAVISGWDHNAKWNANTLFGKTFRLEKDFRTYEFEFPAPSAEKRHVFNFRIDIRGKETVDIADPTLVLSKEEEAAAIAQKKREQAATIPPQRILAADFDSAPQGMNLVSENPVFAPGLNGRGVRLTDVHSVDFKITHSPLDIHRGAVSLWFKPDQDYGFFNWTAYSLWYFNPSGKRGASFQCGQLRPSEGSLYIDMNGTLFGQEWHHFVFNWDPDAGESIWYDGRCIQTGRQLTVPGENSEFFHLGKHWNRNAMPGVIDEIEYFDKPLSAAEIVKKYTAQCPVSPFAMDYSGLAGQEGVYRLGVDNPTGQVRAGTLPLEIRDSASKVVKPAVAKETSSYRPWAHLEKHLPHLGQSIYIGMDRHKENLRQG